MILYEKRYDTNWTYEVTARKQCSPGYAQIEIPSIAEYIESLESEGYYVYEYTEKDDILCISASMSKI